MRKILMWCDMKQGVACCGDHENGCPCYGMTNIKPIADRIGVEFGPVTPELKDKYAITRSPSLLMMQGDVLVRKIIGKNMEPKLLESINHLGWD